LKAKMTEYKVNNSCNCMSTVTHKTNKKNEDRARLS
jgi:hypothetical protein